MSVIDRVVVFGRVPFECHRAIASRVFGLIEDTLGEAFGNEQVVPERKRGVDSGCHLLCCSHGIIVIRISIDRCDADDAIDSKHTACTAFAVEPYGPGRCVGIVEIVRLGRRRIDIADYRDWAS